MARFNWMMTLSVCASLTWMGCSAGDGSDGGEFDGVDRGSDETLQDTSAAEPIGTLAAALQRGPAAQALGFQCSGLVCTCSGDADCNDMFSSDNCRGLDGCDTSDPLSPQCWCFRFKVNRPTGNVALPDVGTTAASL